MMNKINMNLVKYKNIGFLDCMYCPKENTIPNYLFGRTLTNDLEGLKMIVDRVKLHPKGKPLSREPIFECFYNTNQLVKFYFDDDGDEVNNYTEMKEEDFIELCKIRNQYNVDKLLNHFKENTIDISITSYNGFDKSYIKTIDKKTGKEKEPKGGKHYNKRKLSYHYIINVVGTIEQNREIAELYPNFDTTIYPKLNKVQLFRLGKQHKYPKNIRSFKDGKGHRKPKFITNKDNIEKHILQYISSDCLEYKNSNKLIMKEKQNIINSTHLDEVGDPIIEELEEDIEEIVDIPITHDNNIICPILNQLPLNYCNDCKLWLKITLYYKEFGLYDDWHRWCKLSTKYIESWEETNLKIWNDRPKYKGDGKKSILSLCNPCSKERFEKLFNLFNGLINDAEIVDDIIEQYHPYFKVIDYKKDDIWCFNRDTDLWVSISKDYLNCYLTRYWQPHLEELDYKITTEEFEENEEGIVKSIYFGNLSLKEYLKVKQTFKKNINSQGMTKSKNNYIKEFFLRDKLSDVKFRQKLNIDKNILSVKGGKVNLKTKEFSYREQKDNISYELDLEYKPNIKNDGLFEKFLLDILTPVNDELKEGKLSLEYLRRYLGYSITGETCQEKILCLVGNGSNGKSKLLSILQSVLKSNIDIIGTWNSDLFNENIKSNNVNQASPEIYKLYGKRFGFINESKKTLTFGETFKQLVDTGTSITCRELYGSSFEFQLTTNFMMATNSFPLFPIEPSYIRRISTLNLVNNYCNLEDDNREKKTKNDKQINLNIIKDITGTLEQKQSILNWLINASFDYYKDEKLLNLPKSQEDKKEEYINGNNWIKNFKFVDDEKEYIEVNSVYETINLLTSCRVKRDDMINKFIENGAILKRKMIDGKKKPILRKVIDLIELEPNDCLIKDDIKEIDTTNLNKGVEV